MAGYYAKFLGMFSQTRHNQTARILDDQSGEQSGEGVTTRSQSKLPVQSGNKEIPKTPEKPEENDEDEISIDNEPALVETEKKDESESTSKKNRPSSPILFNSETLVAENDSLQAFVVKSYLKRQIKFKYVL